jgi:hypothetical protein
MNQTEITTQTVISVTTMDLIYIGIALVFIIALVVFTRKMILQPKPVKVKTTKSTASKSVPTSPKTSIPIPKKMSPQAFTLLKKNGIYTDIQHIQQEKPNLLSPFAWWNWFFHAKKFKRRLYVIMHKENGYMEMFYAYYMGNLFQYQEGLYIVDEDRLRWNDSLKTFVAEYYEGISVPVQLQRFKTPTKKYLEEAMADSQVEMNLNPNVLYQTVKTEMVQKVMKGEELEKFMNFIKRLLMFVLAGVVITVIAIVGRFV